MLAQRTTLFNPSGTAAARAAAKQAADAGREIIDLTAGEIWADLSPDVRRGAIEAIDKGINRYTDTIGIMELREALAEKVSSHTGQNWTVDEIAVTSGAKQALFHCAMVILNPGDEVIIPAPYWTTFPAQILLAGGVPIFVDTRASGYVPRIDDIKAAITDRTKAIVINTPTNPTGAVYDVVTLMGIAEMAINRNLWVIFDECYGDFVHAGQVHHPITALAPKARPRTLIVNAFSKSLALTGWRIGYLSAPKQVINAVKALQSHTTSNPNVIGQHAVLAHLRRGDGSYESRLRDQLAAGRRLGLALLSSMKRVPIPVADGGFYFYLNLTEILKSTAKEPVARNADHVADRLLRDAGVAAVSGTAFGDPMGLRLSYGVPLGALEVGLHRVIDVLNSWE
ncbi:aminotransferase class I/II-fold pyridoxal phosphate-dependent enzyme [Rhizobium ruizarguesonis]|uniref:aminotransferase class I/II-fold pyridoxal phosphate-dependent enzyme n=1 Tax=Rhizobium ruizarguesonis TaxID=2081791 RepID=UPI00371C93F4